MTDHHDVADVDEKPVLDHARNLVQDQRQLARIADAPEVEVKDVVAFVGLQGLAPVQAQGRLAVQHVKTVQRFLDQRLGRLPAEGDHLDRQGKGPQLRDLLCRVGDDDHPVAGRGHDLFLQQRRTAPLDEVEVRIELVRAVDGQVQPLHVVHGNDL